MIIFESVNITPLINALESLKKGISHPPSNDLERDGIIQRFEFTFELSWKMIRKCLLAMGRSEVSSSPKPVLREALKEHFIDDIEKWFMFLELRNKIAHVYNNEQAEQVHQSAVNFPKEVDSLIKQLQKFGNT